MHLIDVISYWSRTDPHRLALIQPEMVTSYQALADAIDSIGERIDRLALDRDEPIAVSLANPSYFIATVFAVLRSGFSAALVNPALFPLLQSAGIRNLIYDTQGQMLSGGRNIRFDMSWLSGAGRQAGSRPYRTRPIEDVNMIFFTSGTTGLPKKIVQSGAALNQLLKYPFTSSSGAYQKILFIPGLATSYGFNRVCEALNIGKTACFASGSETVLSLVGHFGVEFIVASTAQALALAEAKKKNPDFKLDSLKGVLFGGGKIEPDKVAEIRAALCRNLLSQYGSTEGGVIAVAPFEMLANTPGAVGVIMPWTELQIVDESEQVLPTGAEGFVRYRTPQLIENLKRFGSNNIPGVRGEWFYPGDIGSVTADGILCLTGRSSDVINRGGVKVSGTRIEDILQALPDIKEAAACGVTGPSGLEEIWIAIVPKGSVDVEEIKRQLREHNDVKMAPDKVFVLDELPRGEHGKVQKYRLKELMLSRKQSV
jgi:acyl-coenzyme A synthetase/AMP-(fatty) acid ligase